MSNRRLLRALVLAFVATGCASEPPGAGTGEACVIAADCESGLCTDPDGAWGAYCSATCALDADCDPGPYYDVVCDYAAGLCIRPCTPYSTRGSGASTELCVDGRLVACASQPAASVCEDCGCEPFGGGTCVAGVGCFVPQPDGAPCEVDAECTSGACYRDTGVCGPPRAMGEQCSVDAECASLNCSTDGDETMVGHCNQPLGSSCTAPMTGRNLTPTCNNCQIRFGDGAGFCLRPACDPVDANHCPSFLGHELRCARSVEGTHHCFEVCEDELDDCYYDTVYCRTAGDYCR